MLIESIAGEFSRYSQLVERALDQIDDRQLNNPSSEDGNSAAVLIAHLSGNLISRFTNFLTEDGEKSWRSRDAEFEPNAKPRQVLLVRWHEALNLVQSTLAALSADDLRRRIRIRGVELTVAEALQRALAHFAYHAGQIVLICRIFCGKEWKNLSIPRGASQDYNQSLGMQRPAK